jgi:hypothetical protein
MSLMIVERLANESWCSFQILRVMCSERPWSERLLARYSRVVVSRLRMIGEEMRGRPLGRLTYHVLGSMETWRVSGREIWRCCWILIWSGNG